MWDIRILGVDLYHVLFWLILYSFMGWIWESCYVSIKEKKLVNRGFVTGPVCTIYGVGAMSVYLVLRPLQDHGLWLFLGGIVLATILEYVTSWVMEKLFHTSWWDYSERPFNLHGRICLGWVSFDYPDTVNTAYCISDRDCITYSDAVAA